MKVCPGVFVLLLLRTAFAQTLPLPAELAIPRGIAGSATEEDLEEARKPLPPAELDAKPGKQDFDLQADSRVLFEKIASAFGLNVVFDTGYQPVEKIRFRVNQVDYRDALRAVMAATDSFVTPVSSHLLFVARDNPQKRQEFARTVTLAIPIPDTVTAQEAEEIGNTVRSVLDIRHLMVDRNRHMIVIRDDVGGARAAQNMVAKLMKPAPQVMVEAELMAVDSSSQLHYGLSLPTSFPLVAFGSLKHPNIIGSALPSGIAGYLGFGGGIGFIGIGITETTLFASLSKSFSTTLESASELASQGQPATLKFGTKYPIITSQYVGTGGATTSTAFNPAPSVNFEDLGLTIKVLPHVHGLTEVTLDIEASFKLLAGKALNDIPVIAEREYKGQVRLAAGQSAVVMGLLSGNEARTVTGLAGITDIPVLRHLLSENTHNKDRSETLIVIKPKIVIPPAKESSAPELWVGTEARPVEVL